MLYDGWFIKPDWSAEYPLCTQHKCQQWDGQLCQLDFYLGEICRPAIRALREECERLKAELKRLQPYLPSTICRNTHVQTCASCDDLSCCDNLTER